MQIFLLAPDLVKKLSIGIQIFLLAPDLLKCLSIYIEVVGIPSVWTPVLVKSLSIECRYYCSVGTCSSEKFIDSVQIFLLAPDLVKSLLISFRYSYWHQFQRNVYRYVADIPIGTSSRDFVFRYMLQIFLLTPILEKCVSVCCRYSFWHQLHDKSRLVRVFL